MLSTHSGSWVCLAPREEPTVTTHIGLMRIVYGAAVATHLRYSDGSPRSTHGESVVVAGDPLSCATVERLYDPHNRLWS